MSLHISLFPTIISRMTTLCNAPPKNASVALYSVGKYRYAGMLPAMHPKLNTTTHQVAIRACRCKCSVVVSSNGKIIAARPNIDIVQPCNRNQKSASSLVPGVCGEHAHATEPKIEARRVKVLMITVRIGFHYSKLATCNTLKICSHVSYIPSTAFSPCLYLGWCYLGVEFRNVWFNLLVFNRKELFLVSCLANHHFNFIYYCSVQGSIRSTLLRDVNDGLS